jgi:uncharacterized cupin superfamily protein
VERPHPQEARLVEDEAGGLKPEDDGWYVLNVADSWATAREGHGHAFRLGTAGSFGVYGLNVRVFEPGQVTSLYHAESNQEDFLVLFGECLLLVEGQERRLRQWDFFHTPPWTEHTFVGAGDGPCAVVMIGLRDPDEQVVYPPNEVAARHEAAVEREITEPTEAYASMDWPPPTAVRPPWPPA